MACLGTRWISGEGAVNLIAARFRSRSSGNRGIRCVAIVGFPAVGKTTIIDKIISLVGPDRSDFIDTESYILPREERQALGLSGCAVDSYKIGELQEHLALLHSGQPIEVPVYSGHLGKHTGTMRRIDPAQKRLIVVDGAILLHQELADQFFDTIFIQPYDFRAWLPFAVKRDIRKRKYEKEAAIGHNKEKLDDMLKLCASSTKSRGIRLSCRIADQGNATGLLYRRL